MSSSEWRKVKLGDLVEVSSSKRIYAKEYVDSGIPFYRSKEIIEKSKGNEVSTELYISKERFNELKNKFGAPSIGDILLTSVGSLGVPYIVRKEDFYFKDGNLTWIKNFKNNCHNKFIFYWLLSPSGVNQINSRCIGSTQKALTIDALKKFELKIPILIEQKAIAQILSSLDYKIEVNNQINKTLEKMAQAIFKHWFVDFEFPNESGDPYKSSGGEMIESELGMIPKGWEVKTMEEFTNRFTTGLNPRKNFVLGKGSNFYVTIKNMNNQAVILNDKCDKIDNEAIKVINKRSDLKKRDILFSGIGTIGRICILDETPKNWNISESIFTLRATKDDLAEFLYFLMLSTNFQEYAHLLASGSVQKGIRMADLKKYSFPVSIDLARGKFRNIVSPIINKYKKNQTENLVLTKLRDTLLPKLMSGEIRVPVNESGDEQ